MALELGPYVTADVTAVFVHMVFSDEDTRFWWKICISWRDIRWS